MSWSAQAAEARRQANETVSWVLESITRRAGFALLLVAIVTTLAASRIVDFRTGELQLRLDGSVDSMLPEGDEGRLFYNRVRRLFGNDEFLVLALHDPEGIVRSSHLETVKRLTERLARIEGVHHVLSLANALNMTSVDGDLVVQPFAEVLPTTREENAALERSVLENPLYAGSLLSRDGTTTALVIYVLDRPEQELIDLGIDAQILQIAEAEAGATEHWLTGSLYVKAETSRVFLRDLSLVLPLAVLVMAVIALVSFRSLRGVVIPISSILIALTWTLGIVAGTGIPLNLVTVVVPPVVLVVGFAYTVHVVSEYYDVLRREATAEPALESLREVALPVVLTAATTAAGFASLLASPLQAIQQFGVLSAAGVVCCALTALVFAPALLTLLGSEAGRRRDDGRRLDDALSRLAAFDVKHRRPILLGGALVAALSVLGAGWIEINTNFISTFGRETQVRRHFEAINRHLDGAGSIYVVIESELKDTFKEPENLRQIEALQTWLAEQPEIGGTTSIVDYIKLVHRGFFDNDPERLRIPDSKRFVSQLFYFSASDEAETFVDGSFRTISINARSKAVDSGEVAALVERVEARLAQLPEPLRGRVTGNTVLLADTMDDIAWGQATSLLTAFGIIYLILALLFTSFRMGFLALLPNVLPVAAYFGVLGFSGVTLNVTTGLVACLVLGIAVDDTIHFLCRYNVCARRSADEGQGVREAMRSVGRPVTYTTVALCLGFLTLTTSELRSQIEFGSLAALTLAFAWMVDLVFTPALAAGIRIVSLWDVLSLDLGENPQDSIPLFRGLSKAQARIVALMTRIETLHKGQRLFEIGDEGRLMYIVVDGRLDASVPGKQGRIHLASHERGDVIGEVAFFYGRRTADVDARTDVRVIALDQNSLDRLRRRYPRIASTVFRNLGNTLAHRLARLTERVQT